MAVTLLPNNSTITSLQRRISPSSPTPTLPSWFVNYPTPAPFVTPLPAPPSPTPQFTGKQLAFSSELLGLSFQYPEELGEVRVVVYPGNKSEGFGGQAFSGYFTNSSLLRFGGVTPDYSSAGRGGSITDTHGFTFDSRAQSYRVRFAGDGWLQVKPNHVLINNNAEIIVLNQDSDLDGVIKLGEKGRVAIVNLNGTVFPGVTFVSHIPHDVFEKLLSSISTSEINE